MSRTWVSYERHENGCHMKILSPQADNPLNKSTTTPKPRSGHRIVADDSYIYSVGGLIETGVIRQTEVELLVLSELYRFHILTQQWEKVNIHPPLRNLTASHAMCKLGNSLLIHGGTGLPFGREIDNGVYLINIVTGQSQRVNCQIKDDKKENEPIPAYGQSMTPVPINKFGHYRIYRIFGTIGIDYLSHVYCLYWPHAVWELVWKESSIGPMLQTQWIAPRYRHSSFLIDTNIWVFGGAPIIEAQPNFSTIAIFETHHHRWKCLQCDVTSIPQPIIREGMPVFNSVAKLGQHIYCLGGIDPLTSRYKTFNTIFVLHLNTLQWEYVAKWPKPAYFAAICNGPVGDELYIFGGVSRPEQILKRNCDLWEFRVPFHNVVSLKELSWRSLSTLLRQRLPLQMLHETNEKKISPVKKSSIDLNFFNFAKCFGFKNHASTSTTTVAISSSFSSSSSPSSSSTLTTTTANEAKTLWDMIAKKYHRRFGWPIQEEPIYSTTHHGDDHGAA